MKTMARRGMVASPHYLATGAGLNILRRGGSAVDAAIATNSVLAVVMPYMCGIGGDLFAIVYTAKDGAIIGLNGSGRAPAAATRERVVERAGGEEMPAFGPLPVTVPGCVEAWGKLHDRFGRLPFRELLADAAHYAADGFPVTANFSRAIAASEPVFHPDTLARETFLPAGSVPGEGEVFRQPRLAQTLETIAREGPETYYQGEIGREIVRALQSVGSLMTVEDFVQHRSNWVQPLSIRYRDVDVYELPPNSQGIVALMMLNILQQLPVAPIREGGEAYIHLLAEAARLAYADREAYITDPDHMTIELATLLSDRYARERASAVGERALAPSPVGAPGDTIYLCTADGDGNLVSLIESNFMGFGSGVMGGETGIMLQNRGAWFSLRRDHPNVIAPRKRTMHTLMPGMAFKDGQPWLVFGTMGGSMQPQIHVQILTHLIDQGLQPDEALDAPRFDAVVGGVDGRPRMTIEGRVPEQVLEGLRARGHDVEPVEPYTSQMGHAHLIRVLPNGVYVGAADPRADSLALGY